MRGWHVGSVALYTIRELEDVAIKRRAKDAWNAAHTLLAACSGLEAWIVGGATDLDQGGELIRRGAAAIRTLCGLGVKCAPFQGDADAILTLWPQPLSEMVDPFMYAEKTGPARKQVELELSHAQHVLAPAVREFVELLEQSPQAAFHPVIPLPDPSVDQGFCGAAEIAEKYRVAYGPIRKALEQIRTPDVNGDVWIENEDRRRNMPRYLFRPAAPAVAQVIRVAQAKHPAT